MVSRTEYELRDYPTVFHESNSTGSYLSPTLLTVFIVFAFIACFLVQPSCAMPVSTPTMESTRKVVSLSTEPKKRRHQSHLERRSKLSTVDIGLLILCGIIAILCIFVLCLLVYVCSRCSKSNDKRKGHERENQRTRLSTNEEAKRAIARELRRGTEESLRSGRDTWGQLRNEQPNTSTAFDETQRMGEGQIEEIQLGIGITRVHPVAKPPVYQSEEGLPPYPNTSAAWQILGNGGTV